MQAFVSCMHTLWVKIRLTWGWHGGWVDKSTHLPSWMMNCSSHHGKPAAKAWIFSKMVSSESMMSPGVSMCASMSFLPLHMFWNSDLSAHNSCSRFHLCMYFKWYPTSTLPPILPSWTAVISKLIVFAGGTAYACLAQHSHSTPYCAWFTE
jgi:hypothetical protein